MMTLISRRQIVAGGIATAFTAQAEAQSLKTATLLIDA
jgi:hypothetical protein